MSYWSYLKAYTYNALQKAALALVSDELDKRQGSIIFDAIAPSSANLASMYTNLQLYYQNTHLATAVGDALDARCGDFGIVRETATYAQRIAICKYTNETPFNIAIGTRYSTISEDKPIFYKCIKKLSDGQFVLLCETIGAIGNEYTGPLLPVKYTNGLASIDMTTIYVPGQDKETDTALRARTIDWLNSKPFGGNFAQYKQWALAYEGIGAVQVYPVWNGGGTVKLSIVDSDFNTCSTEFLAQVKEYFDPETYTGLGNGQAPIDHRVTIVTPTELSINVSINVMLDSGVTIESVQAQIESAITEYLITVREAWGSENNYHEYMIKVFMAKIISAALSVSGVINVSSILINGTAADLTLTENATTQQLPKLGTVTISAT